MRFPDDSAAQAPDLGVNESGFRLSESYLAAIAWIENLPQNQNGSDKTWVEETIEESRLHFQKTVRVN